MPAQRLLIFGHSHVWSIKRALDSGLYAPADAALTCHTVLCGTKKFPGTLLCHGSTGSEYINPALVSALADHPPPTPASGEKTWLVSGVQGNYYNIFGMLDEGEPFDFVLPGFEQLPLADDAQILPYFAVRDTLAEQLAELKLFYRRLSRMQYSGIIHLGSPPPNRDADAIAAQLALDPKLAGKTLSVTSAPVRRKLWLLQERLLGNLCKGAGVTYLPAPYAARDPDGFLKPALCKDAVHGTTDYAVLVLRTLEQKVIALTAGASA